MNDSHFVLGLDITESLEPGCALDDCGLGLRWLRGWGGPWEGMGSWSSVPRRLAPCQQGGELPAHTQAVSIWALAARPLLAWARLSALLAWPDVQ